MIYFQERLVKVEERMRRNYLRAMTVFSSEYLSESAWSEWGKVEPLIFSCTTTYILLYRTHVICNSLLLGSRFCS